MLELRSSNNDIVEPYAGKFGARFIPGKKPWEEKVDIAMPCAIQNELDGEDARNLISNGVLYAVEVSNMGCTPEAVDAFMEAKIPLAPGKAANAGGVAVSGLEMSQNSMKLHWTANEVDERLKQIMKSIHCSCVSEGEESNFVNYIKGANRAGFKKVADAMLNLGY